jgi:hypothetical protein
MSKLDDPPRLSDAGSDAPGELRGLFEAAQRDLPSAGDLARLQAKLGPLLDAPAAPTASSSTLGKLGIGLVGGGLVAAGLWLALRPSGPAPLPAPVERPSVVHAPPAPPVEPSAGLSTPEPPPAPSTANPTSAEPSTARAKRPSGIPEDQLLEQARSALRSDPARALSLARQHQVEFPRGALSQEREVIAIEALRRLGRTDEAARRTERFERLFPQSAHQRKLDAPQREK